MVRILYILGICAISATCAVLGLWRGERGRNDPRLEALLSEPGATQALREGEGGSPAEAALITQARAWAALLNPPPVEQPKEPPVDTLVPPEPKPPARLTETAVSFKVVATSYYADKPNKSLALIAEAGAMRDGGRWVREGAQIGHFTVQEIKQGVVVLRDGDNVRELAVERTTIERHLVKEVRPAPSQAKAATPDMNETRISKPEIRNKHEDPMTQ